MLRRSRWRSDEGFGPWSGFALLSVVVLVPTAGVLWFMGEAVRNERFAVRQRLSQVYQSQLAGVQRDIDAFWQQRAERLGEGRRDASAFAHAVRQQLADSVVIYDVHGDLVYPAPAITPRVSLAELAAPWREAEGLESLGRLQEAAAAWGRLAERAGDEHVAGRALQAQLRSLVKAEEVAAAVDLATGELASSRRAGAKDAQGRLIAPDALLLAMDLLRKRGETAAHDAVAEQLRRRLASYEEAPLPALQRRFLLHRLQSADGLSDPLVALLDAENLAASYLSSKPPPATSTRLEQTGLAGIWRLPSPDAKVVGLFESARVLAELRTVATLRDLPRGTELEVLPPGAEGTQREAFLTLALDDGLAGWQLALHHEEEGYFETASRRQIATYRWAGVSLVAAILALAWLVASRVASQMRLTRLKNDLLSNVSHELKTPLSSMRLLVDTLLDDGLSDPDKTREYLELIAAENGRLSRLVESFLTFSRLERGRPQLELGEISLREVAESAALAVRDRVAAAGGQLTVEVARGLPKLEADREALLSALINLLDNACKFSPGEPRVTLAARVENGHVCCSVRDHGIGLSPRAKKRVFERFYQADRRLSRQSGGCGLGLSIVRHIVAAHGGAVDVESALGKGSTFTLRLPTAETAGKRLAAEVA